ncbi:hypothetical protein WN944_016518 [Citrus x changshan-huyou]|uniref:Uncharacterized protein n=1 Tax=Citrus x changshan-huyou TaxID=2935761 RepID=A0AAP0MB42_9ROSI
MATTEGPFRGDTKVGSRSSRTTQPSSTLSTAAYQPPAVRHNPTTAVLQSQSSQAVGHHTRILSFFLFLSQQML